MVCSRLYYIYMIFFSDISIEIHLRETLKTWKHSTDFFDPPGTVAPVTPELLEPPKDRGGWIDVDGCSR